MGQEDLEGIDIGLSSDDVIGLETGSDDLLKSDNLSEHETESESTSTTDSTRCVISCVR